MGVILNGVKDPPTCVNLSVFGKEGDPSPMDQDDEEETRCIISGLLRRLRLLAITERAAHPLAMH
jgi:hypothetical protein